MVVTNRTPCDEPDKTIVGEDKSIVQKGKYAGELSLLYLPVNVRCRLFC